MLDLRKFLKMSVSLILVYAIDNDPDKKNQGLPITIILLTICYIQMKLMGLKAGR